MAKVWALIEFIDGTGSKHEVGEELDLPRSTDEEKRTYDRLLVWGVVSTTQPRTATKDAPSTGRTQRNRGEG